MYNKQICYARLWAKKYYDFGLNPIPSRMDQKRPALSSFSSYLHRDRVPYEWVERFWSGNIQIPLGVRWGHCVVDIDGDEAWDRFESWMEGYCDPVWISDSTRGLDQSCHIWFRIPPDFHEFPTVHLWRFGDRHEGISILGDGSMAVVPPSIHPDRGIRYRWLCGPDHVSRTAILPSWLRSKIHETLQDRQVARSSRPRPLPSGLKIPEFRGHYQRDEVLAQLCGSMHRIAHAYGLEVHRHANGSGFHSCRSIDREDSNWSCTIDPRTGVYHDFATGDTLSFFSLLMRLDPQEFPDFPTAVNKMGALAFGGKPCPSPRR
jgi:hypothetical protein